MFYRLAADAVLVIHLAFVLFVVFGAALVLRWPRVMWLHLPAVVWGVLIEFGGWICPLTPLENSFRMLGGEAGYSGGFIEYYITAALYPDGLTRGVQIALGIAVALPNLLAYGWIFRKRRAIKRRAAKDKARAPG
jgi:hypothetical protein